ncbi:HEAT repeat domain-containing protein [Desulfogranum marinum]|uniref:HEAT repeat domain-containing protein n=1 Tax=Desulfogranum marinum TaxID=453220 RepID=UPI001962D865|nr:HEAT repeat domain-containing protein [Desulfogranum marinum]MBM9515135.1 HEAT repeat domain-containing protein [Desulfogranum marinum]
MSSKAKFSGKCGKTVTIDYIKKPFITLLALHCACFLFLNNSFAESNKLRPKLVSKQQSSKLSAQAFFPAFEFDQSMVLCLERCKKQNQMVSMGIEAIMESCRHQCDVEKALKMTKSSDAETKLEGTRLLCELGNRTSVPVLISLLREDVEKRTGAWADIIPTLGHIGDPRATEILVDLVNFLDDQWLGREMAVKALGEIGDAKATPALINAAWRADTREAAIISLAKFNDPRAASTLVSAIQPEEEQPVREAAVIGLVKLNSAAVTAINEEFFNYSQENKQTQKRVWLCGVLGQIATKEALGVLKKSLTDQDPAVKECAEKYL